MQRSCHLRIRWFDANLWSCFHMYQMYKAYSFALSLQMKITLGSQSRTQFPQLITYQLSPTIFLWCPHKADAYLRVCGNLCMNMLFSEHCQPPNPLCQSICICLLLRLWHLGKGIFTLLSYFMECSICLTKLYVLKNLFC